MPRPTTEQHLLLEQVQHIARGLGETLAPFCEVVVHDLLHPEHAILAIHNNQSGREVGAPATELGLARIADPEFPQVLANYANRYADGRPVKSTSIGIRRSRLTHPRPDSRTDSNSSNHTRWQSAHRSQWTGWP